MSAAQAALAQLRQEFAISFPARLEAAEELHAKIAAHDWEIERARDLLFQIHRISGAAGTFGLASVSTAAREIEERLTALLDSNAPPDHAEWQAIGRSITGLGQLRSSPPFADLQHLRAHSPATSQHESPLVWIAEDSLEQAEYLRRVLLDEGYRVEHFINEHDLLAALQAQDAQMPDAFVMDMILHSGRNAGATLTAGLHALCNPMPPVVFVSERDDMPSRLAALRAGAVRYLAKPVDPRHLLDLLDALTGRQPPEPFRVLMVDDDELVLAAHALALRSRGMQVATLSNPLDTLERLRSFKPDVLILDVYMPGVSGPEVAALLRDSDTHLNLPILFLSAEQDISQQLTALSLGGDDFLVKPVPADILSGFVMARARRARQNALLQDRLQLTLYEREREHLTLNQHATLITTNARWIIQYVNDRFCDICDHSPDSLIGKPLQDLLSGGPDVDVLQHIEQSACAGGVWQGELQHIARDGSSYWLETTVAGFFDATGEPYQFSLVGADITHVKNAEEELRLQRDMHELISDASARLLEASPEKITTALHKTLQLIARRFGAERSYLYRPHHGTAHRNSMQVWCEPGHKSDETARWWGTTIATGENIVIHDRTAAPANAASARSELAAQGVASALAVPIYDDDRVVGYLGVDTFRAPRAWRQLDVQMLELLADLVATALSRSAAEKALLLARKEADRANQAKSEFLSRMSHELRTPMNSILGFAQLLEYDDALDPEQQDNLHEITKAGEHLLELINEVLDLAKIESGHIDISLEPVALRPLAEECIGLLKSIASPRGISIQHNVAENLGVRADRTRLRQALLNLLSNAIKYNREGGQASLQAMPTGRNTLRISVIDTGPGIPPERLDELFEPFNRLGAETSGIEGTGIGLTITRRIVELMSGKIGAESKTGDGSTFWIELPQDTVAEADRTKTSPHGNAMQTGSGAASERRVLYIEDNPANLKLVAQVLGHVPNVHLLTAHAPGLGMDLARAHKPALILLDINMPGMSGYQVLEALKGDADLKDIPVIAITANAMPRDLERGRAAGFFDYLTKPLDIERLLDAVDRGLEESGK